MLTWKQILIGLIIILVDGFVYIALGLLLMNYEDFYDESEGPYWSLSSMTTSEKITYIGFEAWNVINIAAAVYILFRIIKRFKRGTTWGG